MTITRGKMHARTSGAGLRAVSDIHAEECLLEQGDGTPIHQDALDAAREGARESRVTRHVLRVRDATDEEIQGERELREGAQRVAAHFRLVVDAQESQARCARDEQGVPLVHRDGIGGPDDGGSVSRVEPELDEAID